MANKLSGWLFLTFLNFISCKSNTIKHNETVIEEANIESSASETKKTPKKLRYLFFSNGGIIAYFDDGTVTRCPQCDFCKSNILKMFKEKTNANYTVEKDGSLLINGTEKAIPEYNNSDYDGWALIDFKWHIKPPQN